MTKALFLNVLVSINVTPEFAEKWYCFYISLTEWTRRHLFIITVLLRENSFWSYYGLIPNVFCTSSHFHSMVHRHQETTCGRSRLSLQNADGKVWLWRRLKTITKDCWCSLLQTDIYEQEAITKQRCETKHLALKLNQTPIKYIKSNTSNQIGHVSNTDVQPNQHFYKQKQNKKVWQHWWFGSRMMQDTWRLEKNEPWLLWCLIMLVVRLFSQTIKCFFTARVCWNWSLWRRQLWGIQLAMQSILYTSRALWEISRHVSLSR